MQSRRTNQKDVAQRPITGGLTASEYRQELHKHITQTIQRLTPEQATRLYRFAAEYLPPKKSKGGIISDGITESRISYLVMEGAFGRAHRPLRRIANIVFSRIQNYRIGELSSTYSLCSQHRRELQSAAGLQSTGVAGIYTQARQSQYTRDVETFQRHSAELECGVFNYRHRGDRRYHPLQQCNSKNRAGLFASHGYVHAYDVISSIVALSYRRYHQLGGETSQLIESYLENVPQYRRNLARSLGIDTATVKVAINAAIHVRAISWTSGFNQSSSLHKILGNKELVAKFRATFGPLHRELGRVLKFLRPHTLNETAWEKPALTESEAFIIRFYPDSTQAKTLLKSQRRPRQILSAKVKSRIYQSIERQFQAQLEAQIVDTPTRAFFVHDGWYSTHPMTNLVGCTYSNNGPLDLVTLRSWISSAATHKMKVRQSGGTTGSILGLIQNSQMVHLSNEEQTHTERPYVNTPIWYYSLPALEPGPPAEIDRVRQQSS